MRIREIIRMIVVNLIQNKFKVLLTSLGIIIGTVTIILVIAIGRGGEKQIAAQFSNMSAETVYINLQMSPNMNMEDIEKLTPEMMTVMLEENPYLKDIYLRASLYESVQFPGKKENVMLLGVTDGYLEISNYQMFAGDNFTADGDGESRELVLGYGLAKKYFLSPEDAVGKYVQLKGNQYKIVGVLEKKSEGLQGVNPDDTIFMPYGTVLADKLDGAYCIPQAVGMAVDTKRIDKTMRRMRSTLDYMLDDSSIYVIEDAGSRIDAAMQSARTMKLLLISVAAIVFVVGGIGIMNVLFVTVRERTKEIGILKAVGTSKKDILLLFLLESVGIGCVGGLLGILLSYLMIPLMAYTQIPVDVSPEGKLIAFAFAIATSTIFGFYPAHKAAQMKPVDALNYE